MFRFSIFMIVAAMILSNLPRYEAYRYKAYLAETGIDRQYNAWAWAKNAGSVSVAKDNYLLAKIQYDDANWQDHVIAAAKDIITLGGYSEYQLRQRTADTSVFAGGGLGSQLAAQSENLRDIYAFDRWRAEFDKTWDNLPPAYRAQWAQDMLFKSSGSVIGQNIISIVKLTGPLLLIVYLITYYATSLSIALEQAAFPINITVQGGISTIQNGINIIRQFLARRIKILILAVGALAAFWLVDLPLTVRTKAFVINMLPLNAQTKYDVVRNLCTAAFPENNGASIYNCLEAYSYRPE